MNIARPGVHAEKWPAAAHFTVNRFVRIPDAPLHRHLHRGTYIDGAGTGRNVRIKRGIRRQSQTHIAGPSAGIPGAALLPLGGDFAAAGFSMEAALYTSRGDVPRTRMHVD